MNESGTTRNWTGRLLKGKGLEFKLSTWEIYEQRIRSFSDIYTSSSLTISKRWQLMTEDLLKQTAVLRPYVNKKRRLLEEHNFKGRVDGYRRRGKQKFVRHTESRSSLGYLSLQPGHSWLIGQRWRQCVIFSPNQGSRTRYIPCDCVPCVFWSKASHDINAVYSAENIRVSSIMKLTMWYCVKSHGNYLFLLSLKVDIFA